MVRQRIANPRFPQFKSGYLLKKSIWSYLQLFVFYIIKIVFLMPKCIWYQNPFDAEHFPKENVMLNIFLWKMWCWTFSKGKCDAEHFPKENVMLNILQSKMYAEHFPLENVRQNAFVTFCWCVALQKCICNILCYKMYASNAFLHQMHFCKTKCDAEHFTS